MNRKEWLLKAGVMLGSSKTLLGQSLAENDKKLFGDLGNDFYFGVANAAFQVEGACNVDGKLPSIWDEFTRHKENVKNGQNALEACDFYHRYSEDIQWAKSMGFKHFRFSISWTRVVQADLTTKNQSGVDFYRKVIREILCAGLQPWVTLYHWDLPQLIEDEGGWANRSVVKHFDHYVKLCTKEFGSLVERWILVNEPAAFVSLGYLNGYHAPGRKSPFAFLRAVHHVCLAVAQAGQSLREICPNSKLGIAYSYSPVHGKSTKDHLAVKRVDAFINRLFVEPFLGLGYPNGDLPVLKRLDKYIEPGDMDKIKFNFDFVGVQYYFRVVVGSSPWVPFFGGREIPAAKRGVMMNSMNREIYPEGMLESIVRFHSYGFKEIVVTENGVCYNDEPKIINDVEVIEDQKRIEFYRSHLEQVAIAKAKGAPVTGFFAWSLSDNFEWAEGYRDRFGLVYIDFSSQRRILKDSGRWWQRNLCG